MQLTMDDLTRLLAPIDEAAPCGSYLKAERALFRPLRNQFNIAQTSFRKLSQNPDPAELDDLLLENATAWEQLADQLVEVTTGQSKDLELMSWLAMSQLFHGDPLAGFSTCLQLISRCITDYWDALQPQTPDNKLRAGDEAGKRKELFELKLRPLLQLLGESEDTGLAVTPLRMLPLIDNIDYVFFQNAERHMTKAELHEKVRAAMSQEKEEVIERVLQYQAVLDALDSLEAALAAQAKAEGIVAPSCRFLKQQVNHNLNAIRSLTDGILVPWPLDQLKAAPAAEPVAPEQPAAAESTEAAQPVADAVAPAQAATAAPVTATTAMAAPSQAPQPIYDRDQAFAQLRLIADYFARTEPQSPVSYLIEKAIRWGYTPLGDLMSELLAGNSNQLARIDELTGMAAGNRIDIPGQPARGIVEPPQPEVVPVHPALNQPAAPAAQPAAASAPAVAAAAPVAPAAPVVPPPAAPQAEPAPKTSSPAVSLPADLAKPASDSAGEKSKRNAPSPFGNLTELM